MLVAQLGLLGGAARAAERRCGPGCCDAPQQPDDSHQGHGDGRLHRVRGQACGVTAPCGAPRGIAPRPSPCRYWRGRGSLRPLLPHCPGAGGQEEGRGGATEEAGRGENGERGLPPVMPTADSTSGARSAGGYAGLSKTLLASLPVIVRRG